MQNFPWGKIYPMQDEDAKSGKNFPRKSSTLQYVTHSISARVLKQDQKEKSPKEK